MDNIRVAKELIKIAKQLVAVNNSDNSAQQRIAEINRCTSKEEAAKTVADYLNGLGLSKKQLVETFVEATVNDANDVKGDADKGNARDASCRNAAINSKAMKAALSAIAAAVAIYGTSVFAHIIKECNLSATEIIEIINDSNDPSLFTPGQLEEVLKCWGVK